MPEWENMTFKDIAEFNPRESIRKGEIAVKVAMDKLQPFCRDVPEIELAEFKGGAKFRNGDTIMARITPCLENGKTAMINVLENDQIGFGSTEYIVLRAKPGITDPHFLYYLVCSPIVREPAIKSMIGSSGRQRVQTDVVQNLELLIPPLSEQVKIGALLKGIDDKIAINTKINRNLSEQAQALYKYWFVDCDWNECVVPSIWKEVTIEELTSLVTRGITPKYHDESDQIVINQKCIRNHMINLELARTHTPKSINEKWIQFGDVLINSTGEGTLGRAAQVMFTPTNMTVDTHVTIVRPMSRKLIYYIGQWVIANEREIEAQHTGSTGQTELPRDRVKSMKLRRPDDKILMRFNECIGPMMEQIIKNQEENARLAEMRDILLPRLMSGKLDVSALVL